MPMPSRSVRPAGKRHSYGGYAGGADTPDRPVACQGCAGQRPCASGWGVGCRRRSKRPIRWALPSARASARRSGSERAAAAARGGYWRARQGGASAATAGPGASGAGRDAGASEQPGIVRLKTAFGGTRNLTRSACSPRWPSPLPRPGPATDRRDGLLGRRGPAGAGGGHAAASRERRVRLASAPPR
jgi:hypothetical protein